MQKFVFLGGAALLSIGTAALAQPGTGRAAPNTRADVVASVDARFAKMDVNGDGVTDSADRAAMKAQRFAALDSDRNGELTEAELEAGRQARREKMRERRSANRAERRADRPEPSAEQKRKWAERRVNRAGKGGDRRTNWFAIMDKNGNGTLSLAEFSATPEQSVLPGGRKNGKHHRRGMGMRMMADADKNGTIALEEMRNAALARFDKVDTDGDGTISAAERQAAREARKARRATMTPTG